ncbi:MAG: hypothetical protein DHS80DRAFT_23761 [Piptocephalis tieghemiana]|nr:MAG: hypothetical protein DHS80DRAFT_23761 [Piptocephalis tieghemiana]
MVPYATALLLLASSLTLFPSWSLGVLAPSIPFGETVFQVDQPQTVVWREDAGSPILEQLGPLTLELCAGAANNIQLIKVLETGVNPQALKTQIVIPKAVGFDGKVWAIRFRPSNASEPIYSTYFTLRGTGGPTYKNPVDVPPNVLEASREAVATTAAPSRTLTKQAPPSVSSPPLASPTTNATSKNSVIMAHSTAEDEKSAKSAASSLSTSSVVLIAVALPLVLSLA